jgi:DNA-binding NtrC family response regulator
MATVLIVDDEEMVIRVARKALELVGHKVCVANSRREADQVAKKMDHIDVLIVNHCVPPDSGRSIAEDLLRTHPEARVMHVSGYPRSVLESEGSLTPGSSFLAKPFGITQIQNHVSSILSMPAPAARYVVAHPPGAR